MKTAIAISLLFVTTTAAQADPLPRTAQALVDQRQNALARIDRKLASELEKEKIRLMKLGDLEGANAVESEIKSTEKRLENIQTKVLSLSSTAPIRFRAGMKLLWCPDAYASAFFILEEGGKIRSLDDKTWQGSTSHLKWESKKPGSITLVFSNGSTTMVQRKDSQMLEGKDPSKKNSRARLVVVGQSRK